MVHITQTVACPLRDTRGKHNSPPYSTRTKQPTTRPAHNSPPRSTCAEQPTAEHEGDRTARAHGQPNGPLKTRALHRGHLISRHTRRKTIPTRSKFLQGADTPQEPTRATTLRVYRIHTQRSPLLKALTEGRTWKRWVYRFTLDRVPGEMMTTDARVDGPARIEV